LLIAVVGYITLLVVAHEDIWLQSAACQIEPVDHTATYQQVSAANAVALVAAAAAAAAAS
jgi:hypothetical protein